jgi:hypothetical protein
MVTVEMRNFQLPVDAGVKTWFKLYALGGVERLELADYDDSNY